jgi:hypothetical protein
MNHAALAAAITAAMVAALVFVAASPLDLGATQITAWLEVAR